MVHTYWQQLNILHEPLLPVVVADYGTGPSELIPLLKYQAQALHHRNYAASNSEYCTLLCDTQALACCRCYRPTYCSSCKCHPGKYFHYGQSLVSKTLTIPNTC